jgi:carbamoyltransferase
MYILGINSYSHDSGACILYDNGTKLEIVTILESRLNRVKRSLFFPLLSIQYCMSHFGLKSLDEIDLVCGVRHQSHWPSDEEMLENVWLDRGMQGDTRPGADFAQQYVLNNAFFRGIKDVHWVHHMDAHAASAHYVSGFEHSVNISIDAGGVGIYEGNGISPLRIIDRAGYSGSSYQNGVPSDKRFNRDCLGTLFMNATNALGFSTDGTTMALACFAKEEAGGAVWLQRGIMSKLLGRGELNLSEPEAEADFYMTYTKTIQDIHKYAHRNAEGLKAFKDSRYDYGQADRADVLRPAVDIAYKVQSMLEQEMIRLARLAKEKIKATKLCISGGIGLSCVTNRIIYDLGIFDEIFIQPAASDEGLAFGAALYGYYNIKKGERRHHMTRSYFGRQYPPSSVEKFAAEISLKGSKSTPHDVAKLIVNGKIIGRFTGRSEFGPRALGNRSLLADARDAGVARKINEIIKQREWFRPFAPACILV